MDEFSDIRPYLDHEIRPVIDALLENPEFISSLGRFRSPRLSAIMPWLVRRVARRRLARQLATVNSVATLQDVVALYMKKVIADTTTGVTTSGLDKLDHSRAYLFVSNHRDIAMDPAFVNYILYQDGMGTLQIAIGDNLLKKPFVTDLMRLNKSFIVKRSLKGRELLKALDHMSRYIHSCLENHHNVWIAQREGRAKDGVDRTDPALVKMLARGRRELPLGASIASLHVVPVSISYEYDACDQLKAEELFQIETVGKFEKTDASDIHSIVTGIVGFKGQVHVAFGEELQPENDDPDEIASRIDRQIVANYRLHDTNLVALQLLKESGLVEIPALSDEAWEREPASQQRDAFTARLARVDRRLHKHFLSMYANPVISRYRLPGQ